MTHQTLKPWEIEELVDHYFFRRLAHYLVPVFARLRLTPNQVSFLGLCVGLGTAWLFAHRLFFLGGLGLLLTVVLDCCDGQLARLTGQTTQEGRLIDGIFDHIWVAFIWVYIGLSGQLYEPAGYLTFGQLAWLESLAGASILFHCGLHIPVKTQYLELAFPQYSEKELSRAEAIALLKKNIREKKPHFVAIYTLVFLHMLVFGSHKKHSEAIFYTPEQRAKIREALKFPVRLLSWTGEGTHHAIMITFALLTPLWHDAMLATFWIILVPMNLYWFWGLWIWFQRKKRYYSGVDTALPLKPPSVIP